MPEVAMNVMPSPGVCLWSPRGASLMVFYWRLLTTISGSEYPAFNVIGGIVLGFWD